MMMLVMVMMVINVVLVLVVLVVMMGLPFTKLLPGPRQFASLPAPRREPAGAVLPADET